MSNPRKSIKDLKLQGSKNLKRALGYDPQAKLAKREDMEQLYSELLARRLGLLADVKRNGVTIIQEKFSSRGELYQTRVINPAFTLLQSTERQLVQLSRLLTAFPKQGTEPEPKANSFDPPEDESFDDFIPPQRELN